MADQLEENRQEEEAWKGQKQILEEHWESQIDEHYSSVMRKKSENLVGDIEKMNSETISEFRDDLERKYDELSIKVEEILDVFRNVFVGTALVSVSAVGLAVIDTQMQHKNS